MGKMEATPYDAIRPETVTMGDNAYTGVRFSPIADNHPQGWLSWCENLYVDKDGSARSCFGYSSSNVMPDVNPAMGGPIAGLSLIGETLVYAAIAHGGAGNPKLWGLTNKVRAEIKLPSATSFAFPDSGLGVRMARVGAYLVGVPGSSGGRMFKTDGEDAWLLQGVFSLSAALSVTSSARSLSSLSGIGWSVKSFVGASAAERNFSADGVTLNAKWVTTGSPSIADKLDANDERCIELDNNAGAETVYTDPTGSTDISDNYASLASPHSSENHLMVVEFEAAAEDSADASPAISPASPWAFVDVTITAYSDSGGTTPISGGAITIRSGPHAETTSTKERLVFDFRGVEERTGASVASYRLKFENPYTATGGGGGIPGIDINRVYWHAPARSFRVAPPLTSATLPAWDVYQGSHVAKGGVVYTAGTNLQLVEYSGTLARDLATRAWRMSAGISLDAGASSFRARGWIIVGTSATSTYGTKRKVFSTNEALVSPGGSPVFFEFAKEGTTGYVHQMGMEILDDILVPGADKTTDVRLFSVSHTDLTGYMSEDSAYQYIVTFADTAETTYPLASGWEGPESPVAQVTLTPWQGHASFTSGTYSKPTQECTRMLVWRAGGAFTDGLFRLVAMFNCSGTANDSSGRWSYVSGTFTDYRSDEDLFSAPVLSRGRDNPPENAQCLLYHGGRLWVGVGASVWVSHLVENDSSDEPIYFSKTSDFSDPQITLKGSVFNMDKAAGSTTVHQLLPYQGGVLAWTNRGPVHILGTDARDWSLRFYLWDQGLGIANDGAAIPDGDGVKAVTSRGIVRFQAAVNESSAWPIGTARFDPIDTDLAGAISNVEWGDTGLGWRNSAIWLQPFSRNSVKTRGRHWTAYLYSSTEGVDLPAFSYNEEADSWSLWRTPPVTCATTGDIGGDNLAWVGCADGLIRQLINAPTEEVTYKLWTRIYDNNTNHLIRPQQIEFELEISSDVELTVKLQGDDGWAAQDGGFWSQTFTVASASRRVAFVYRDVPRYVALAGLGIGIEATTGGEFAVRSLRVVGTQVRQRRRSGFSMV